MRRRLVCWLAVLGGLSWVVSCSSGLGNGRPRAGTPGPSSSNLPVGLDLGLVPTAPLGELAAAGVVVPAIGGGDPHELVLLGFATAARADNGNGTGTALSRDTTVDANSVDDVFVALVSARHIEPAAFSQKLAGKFRHPRCVTCHSMQAADTQAFVSSPQLHAGPAPGPGFPNNDPSTCVPCHVTSTNAPVSGWMAPAASFDIRNKTVAQLAVMAQNVPAGDPEHFVSDRRVLWALDSGVLPAVNGRNGIADDNHNGVLEPEDVDGVIRTVPGGSRRFLDDIEAWHGSGNVVTNAQAVRDVTLVSRAAGTNQAGNGASNAPKLLWVPNPSFNPTSAVTAAATNPVGTLHVVFTSTASNLVAGDGNGAADVFVARLELRAEQDALGSPTAGGLNLQLVGTTELVSARNGTSAPGNGAAEAAAIGGADGEFVVFTSRATDLIAGFTDGNGPSGADVFLRHLPTQATTLVSHTVGNAATGGNGAATAPAIDARGTAVAFAANASDLIASDGNGAQDVFFARIGTGSPYTKVRASVTANGGEGSGGACTAPSVQTVGSRVLVAFESAKTDLATIAANPNVYLFDSQTGHTTLCNQRITASAPTPVAGDGAARTPVLAADGSAVCFESAARNIDVLRPIDNRVKDVFLVEIGQLAQGFVLPYRVSVGVGDAGDANGDSTQPVFGVFPTASRFPVGFAAYPTLATNLGTSDSTPIMVAFLSETSGVQAEFAADVVRGAAPLTVAFTDQSSGSPTQWAWDFDDNGRVDSRQQNPTHVYRTPGTYSVRLSARNSNSEGTKTEAALIRVLGPTVANFTASTTAGPAPLAVDFTDTSTEEPESWQWDFDNDGVVDSTAQNPSHTYTTPGTYTVRMVATNPVNSATRVQTNLITVFTPVAAEFTGTPLAGLIPLPVTFTNLTTGDATTWAWDFDNDSVVDSTARDPSFTYTTPGTYTVVLTASGPGGTNTRTRTAYVAVAGPVVAEFTASATREYNTTAIQFTDQSTGTVSSWAWDFENDGIVDSTLQNPTHVFSTPATYSVRLTVSGPGGTDFELKSNFFVSVPSSVSATLEANRDTSIYSENPDRGAGDYEQIVCGNAATMPPTVTQVGIRRALLSFDVAGGVPAGATILSAQLQLKSNFAPTNPTGTQNVALHLVTAAWGEGTAGLGGIGAGAPATAGSATWSHAFFNTTAWTAGGSLNPSPRATTAVTGVGFYTWSGSNVVADVQSWLGTPSGNHGWMLRSGETSGIRTAKVFDSRTGPTPADRPKLILTYRPAL